jgi:tripartite-type tricarboxylate transporter receptor subunit TctC
MCRIAGRRWRSMTFWAGRLRHLGVPVAVMPFVVEGKVKALAVSTLERFPLLPQVPTVAESAIPGFETANWCGLVAPARVPPDVVARVGEALREITALSDVQNRMSTLGFIVDFRKSDEFRALIARDHQKYGAIIREAGIQPE